MGDLSRAPRLYELLAQSRAVPLPTLIDAFTKYEDSTEHPSVWRGLKETHRAMTYEKEPAIAHALVSPQRDAVPIQTDRGHLVISPDNSRKFVNTDVLAFAGSPVAPGHANNDMQLPFSVGKSWGELRTTFNTSLKAVRRVIDNTISETDLKDAQADLPTFLGAGIVASMVYHSDSWPLESYISRHVLGTAFRKFVEALPNPTFDSENVALHEASAHSARTLLIVTRLADSAGCGTKASHAAAVSVINTITSTTNSNQNNQSGNGNNNGNNGNGNNGNNGNGNNCNGNAPLQNFDQ